MVPTMKDIDTAIGKAPPGGPECTISRCRVTYPPIISQMEGTGEVCQWILGLMSGRPVCYTAKPPTPTSVAIADPHAIATNAFKMRWLDVSVVCIPSIFPGRQMSTQGDMIWEGCTIVLIALVWPAQSRFPILLKCLIEYHILLPKHRQLLTDLFNQLHPL